jgi:hypothetical protein
MIEYTQRAHISSFNKKINQMIIIINGCEKNIRILRLVILEHLETMIETQMQHMEGIYSSYKTPIEEPGEKYTYSIIRPLHQLLENVNITLFFLFFKFKYSINKKDAN